MSKINYFFIGLLILGILCFDQAVEIASHSKDVPVTRDLLIKYVICLFLGIFGVGLPLCYFSVLAGLVDLVSAGVLMFDFMMMPIFELVMGEMILWWILFIFFPSLIYLSIRRKKLE